MRWLVALVAFSWCLHFLLPRGEAAADDTTANDAKAQARAAFRRGTELTRDGRWAEALAAYEQSATLHPHATATYNIGYCERALGRYTRARHRFLQSLTQGKVRPDELSDELRTAAKQYLEHVNAKLAQVEVILPANGIAIAVDGRPLLAEGALFIAGVADVGPPIPVAPSRIVVLVNPGDHVFVIQRDGAEATKMHRATEGSTTVLLLDLPAPPHADPEPTTDPRVPWNRAPYQGGDRTAAYMAFGLGATAVVTGIVALVVASNAKNTLDEQCTSVERCPADASEVIARLNHSADVATISFMVGGVTAALGAVLVWVGAPVETRDSALTIQF